MIDEIKPEHYSQFLSMNKEFVHWLAPMDEEELKRVLSIATYKCQIAHGKGALIGYPHDADYPDHKNIAWLRRHTHDFFYIDRIIIAADAQGQGLGRKLYEDVEIFAKSQGYSNITCEVNTKPNNPGSHAFHKKMGYTALGDVDYPSFNATLRYYKKDL